MLHLPAHSSSTATLIGIDPGSEYLGVAVIEFDIDTFKIVRTTAQTYVGSKFFVGDDNWLAQVHGDRVARIDGHKKNLVRTFKYHKPIKVACESPFYSLKRPSAFGALMEVLIAIREAVIDYDSWRTLFLIDPPTVKKAVGASGNADKLKVKEKVLQLKEELNYEGDTELKDLDEHSIDAIAVAYCQYKDLIH